MNLLFKTYSEAEAINNRITASCIQSGKWQDGVTNNYCIPIQNEYGQWGSSYNRRL